MQDIVVFSNPNSGANKKDKSKVKVIQKIIGNNGLVCSPKNPNSLEKIISDLHRHNPKAVVISGGDGTVASVVTTLMAHWPLEKELPPFGVIPSGTINILARECAMPRKSGPNRALLRPFSYVRNLLSEDTELDYIKNMVKMPEDNLFYRDVDFMKISDNNGTKVYGFSFGTGLIVSLLQEYYKAKHLKWLKISSMAMRLVWSSIFNGKYYRTFNSKANLSVDGEEPEDYLSIMAQTLQSIGMPKSSSFYKAQLSSGKFHLLGTKFDLDKFLRYSPAFYAGDEIPGMLDVQTDKVVLSSEREFSYQVNGDLDFMGRPFKAYLLSIEHGIKCKIIQPRNEF